MTLAAYEDFPTPELVLTRATGYTEFLERKAQMDGSAGFEPLWLPEFLFPFQQMLTDWAIQQGRGALFVDCGGGKGPMALVWAQNVYKYTGKPVLLLTRLGVTEQMVAEGAKFGVDAEISRNGKIPAPVTVTAAGHRDAFPERPYRTGHFQ